MQLSVNPEVVHGFEVSRRKVVEALTNMNFAKIVSIVQLPNKLDPTEPHFQGEVEEVFASKHRSAPRHAFFSRFSRNTQGVSVMGCFTIVDTPMGTAQASALPQLGDVLVGSFVEAGRKGKIPFEFKGWCNNGKPLLELLRVLQFGTRMSAKELHTLLRQPASITAAFALRLNANTSASQRRHAQKVSQSVDDIWNIARALCFKDLSLDESLKTSMPHWDMMTQLAMVTLDEEFLDDLNKIKPACEMYVPDPPPPFVPQQSYGYGISLTGEMIGAYGAGAYGTNNNSLMPQPSDFGNKTPEYYPTSSSGKTPPYVPASPPYQPSSPSFAPSSPVSKSPPRMFNREASVHSNSSMENETEQAPMPISRSPKYSPESPVLPCTLVPQHKSPRYAPESPKDILGMLPKFDIPVLNLADSSSIREELTCTLQTSTLPATQEISKESKSDIYSPKPVLLSTSSAQTLKKPRAKRTFGVVDESQKDTFVKDTSQDKEISKKEPVKRKRVSKATLESNPIIYSPGHTTSIKETETKIERVMDPKTSSNPVLYSPSSVPFTMGEIKQAPFSPQTGASASSTGAAGKSILGSLLAKINSPRPLKMDIVSYEDI